MEQISVKNYRSISDSGEIAICPLTVAVGKNSAGKSSFVRLFPLLKQTLERKISDSLLWYGDYVDFGDYQHTVSKQKSDQPIEIAFSIMTKDRYYGRYLKRNDSKQFLVRVELSIREKYIERVSLEVFDQHISIFINELGRTKIVINGDERPFEKKQLLMFPETGNIIPTIYEEVENISEKYIFRGLNLSDIIEYCRNYIYPNQPIYDRKEILFSSSIYDNELDIEIDSKEKILKKLKKINIGKFKSLKVDHKRFEKINNLIIATKIIAIIDRINLSISTDMKQTSYLKPIRAMVNRYYRVQGISIDELDADGSNLPMILKNMSKSQLLDFEKWSKEKFGVVFSVTPGEGHISLIIKNDVGGKIETNVADTGYGYSQMLPIVMLLWMIHSKNLHTNYEPDRTIVIEQPELHLHPAYQAKMIDVFVSVINEAQKNGISIKIIFETHSEAMINRIGTLVSEGRIEANKINILVFSKIEDQTVIESKQFNDKGLLMGWPIGFFATEED